MIRMEEELATAFEIRATPAADAPSGAYYLTLEHACERQGPWPEIVFIWTGSAAPGAASACRNGFGASSGNR